MREGERGSGGGTIFHTTEPKRATLHRAVAAGQMKKEDLCNVWCYESSLFTDTAAFDSYLIAAPRCQSDKWTPMEFHLEVEKKKY